MLSKNGAPASGEGGNAHGYGSNSGVAIQRQWLRCGVRTALTAEHAGATDLASVITLANELRTALVEKGLIKGGA